MEETIVTEALRQDVRQRAKSATTKSDIVNAIFEALTEANIDLNHVSLEDFKRIVVEAVRAARRSTDSADRFAA
jgi:hypothetical protein